MKRKTKFILIILFALITLVGLYAYLEYHRKPTDLSTLKSQTSIFSDSLMKLYALDETKANSLYLGKMVDVNGIIAEVSNQNDTLVNITLGNNKDIHKVSCIMDVHHINEIRSYKAGDKIILRGICNGYLMDVELNRCVLIK